MSETRERNAPAAPGIDARAVVSPRAVLAPGVSVGAFAIIGDDVELGEDCFVHAHAVLRGPARLGRGNVLHPFCSIGCDPQDLKYVGEPTTLEIGDRNVFRECVTVSRGTVQGGGVTRIGSDNLFMAYAHIAHDCTVGSRTIFANSATLAGHVIVEDFASVGAFSPVHQFCRVGRYAYIGACTAVTQDVLPFSLVVSERANRCFGINAVGLERQGFGAERIEVLKRAYRLLLRSKLNTAQAVERMRATLDASSDVAELIAFIESSERGLIK
jgi:UDP-N-acetylglucosamine acyltransferase